MNTNEIVSLYHTRKNERGPIWSRMAEIRDQYNGDLVVPLPELDQNERSSIPNLIKQGIDKTAQRIASTMPTVYYPPTKAGDDAAEKRARLRRLANLAWWDRNRMGLKQRKRARHLIAYASSPVVIRPDLKDEYPRWHVRDPLSAFPSPQHEDDPTVENCIFAIERSYGWLKTNYGTQASLLKRPDHTNNDTKIGLLEYADAQHTVLLAQAPISDATNAYGDLGSLPSVLLEDVPNRAEVCCVINPLAVSLDRPLGQFDGLVGMYWLEAKLMALMVHAVQRGVFPETWMVSRPGEQGKIITVADPVRGQIGEMKGGELREIRVDPGFVTNQMISTLERNQRIEGSIPAEFGGESTSNIRTGRRGDAVLSAAVDFGIQEAQHLFEAALVLENERAIAIDKAYWGNQKKSFYTSKQKRHDYVPNQVFDSSTNIVKYSQAGTDINNLVISGGQRVGIGTMSKRTFMEIDPLVDDPETESDTITAEALEDALLQSIQTQAAQGAIPPNDLARIVNLVKSNKMELAGAVEQVQQEAQQRQAEQVPVGAPEAQPGLAQPGMGAESPETIAEPEPSLGNLSQLLTQLGRPSLVAGA